MPELERAHWKYQNGQVLGPWNLRVSLCDSLSFRKIRGIVWKMLLESKANYFFHINLLKAAAYWLMFLLKNCRLFIEVKLG